MEGCTPRNTLKIKQTTTKPKTLEELVNDYLRKNPQIIPLPKGCNESHQERHDMYLKTLEDITDFICGRPNNTKAPNGPKYIIDDHQWPLRCASRQHLVNEIAENLKDIDKSEYKDFEDLMMEVEKCKVSFFGETAKYDFALRYGWKKGVRPEKYVYVHSKPRLSAQHLVDKGYLSRIKELERKMEVEKYEELLLPGMTAHDVEHFLCMYHDYINEL